MTIPYMDLWSRGFNKKHISLFYNQYNDRCPDIAFYFTHRKLTVNNMVEFALVIGV